MFAACFGRKSKGIRSGTSSKPLINSTAIPDEDLHPNIKDEQLWSIALTKCASGEISFAVVNGNYVVEDHSQVETGPHGTFIGVYDGHGGAQTSQFLKEHLFKHFQNALAEDPTHKLSPDVLSSAFLSAESSFTDVVRANWRSNPHLASCGSCALVGVVAGPHLCVASLGDSRAVLGTYRKAASVVAAVQLSTDHNANYRAVRQEMEQRYPEERDIVVNKAGVWRVKGIIQITRAIGDVYLKSQEFQQEPLLPKFRLPEPLKSPVLSAEPTTVVRVLKAPDQFVIFASDGLWEHISNQEAVDMVHAYPKAGIARRLIVAALMRAAQKRGVTYGQIKLMKGGKRRDYHDDISVVVHFFNHELLNGDYKSTRPASFIGGESSADHDVHKVDNDEMERMDIDML